MDIKTKLKDFKTKRGILPLTTADQVVKKDGTRLEDADGNIKTTEIYSTSETVVGKWINGEPLYRIVIPFRLTGTSTTVPFPDPYFNIIDCRCWMNAGSGLAKRSMNFPTPAENWKIWTEFNSAVGGLHISMGSDVYADMKDAQHYAIIEYTKTTD